MSENNSTYISKHFFGGFMRRFFFRSCDQFQRVSLWKKSTKRHTLSLGQLKLKDPRSVGVNSFVLRGHCRVSCEID
jgi:hypothetical protein